MYTYPSFLSTYAVDGLGATKVMAGMIVGSYGLTQMVLRIPPGIASDQLKKRKLFVMIGFGLSIAACSGLSVVVPQCGSQIIAILLGAQLADRLGELYAFLLAAAAGIAGLIVMSMVRERPPAGAPVTLKSFAAVAKNRQLIIGTLLATIISWSCGLRCGRRTGTDHALLPDLQL